MKFVRFKHGVSVVMGPRLNKVLETSVCRGPNEGLNLNGRFVTRQDHAGLSLYAEFFGLTLEFALYDNRHWNAAERRWMSATEEDKREQRAALDDMLAG